MKRSPLRLEARPKMRQSEHSSEFLRLLIGHHPSPVFAILISRRLFSVFVSQTSKTLEKVNKRHVFQQSTQNQQYFLKFHHKTFGKKSRMRRPVNDGKKVFDN